jgi:hypothetical protein
LTFASKVITEKDTNIEINDNEEKDAISAAFNFSENNIDAEDINCKSASGPQSSPTMDPPATKSLEEEKTTTVGGHLNNSLAEEVNFIDESGHGDDHENAPLQDIEMFDQEHFLQDI